MGGVDEHKGRRRITASLLFVHKGREGGRDIMKNKEANLGKEFWGDTVQEGGGGGARDEACEEEREEFGTEFKLFIVLMFVNIFALLGHVTCLCAPNGPSLTQKRHQM